MVNYYSQFRNFKEQRKLKGKMLLDQFEKEMILFFGFGGRSRAISRWLDNFQNVGLIKMERDQDGIWWVHIL